MIKWYWLLLLIVAAIVIGYLVTAQIQKKQAMKAATNGAVLRNIPTGTTVEKTTVSNAA